MNAVPGLHTYLAATYRRTWGRTSRAPSKSRATRSRFRRPTWLAVSTSTRNVRSDETRQVTSVHCSLSGCDEYVSSEQLCVHTTLPWPPCQAARDLGWLAFVIGSPRVRSASRMRWHPREPMHPPTKEPGVRSMPDPACYRY